MGPARVGHVDRQCRAGALHDHRGAVALAVLQRRVARRLLGRIIVGLAIGAAFADGKGPGGERLSGEPRSGDRQSQDENNQCAALRDSRRNNLDPLPSQSRALEASQTEEQGNKAMSLQGKLDALKTEFETKMAPPAAVAVMHRVTDELIASGQAERAVKAGDHAPEFTLPDPEGKLVASQELLAKGPLVVTFYRGAWCPYCNLDLQALEEARPEIEARGASFSLSRSKQPRTAASLSAAISSAFLWSETRALNLLKSSDSDGTCPKT
jgi:AhpC/TSA family